MKKLICAFKKYLHHLREEKQNHTYTATYRVLDILEDEEKNYTVEIQVVRRNFIFQTRPEEILADDELVNQFSPKDIRTLTYLGYLGINAPKYKILAQRLAGNDKTVFALKKRGKDEVVVKTAAQILKEQDILSSMSPEDAKVIGYTVASEALIEERELRKQLLNNTNESNN